MAGMESNPNMQLTLDSRMDTTNQNQLQSQQQQQQQAIGSSDKEQVRTEVSSASYTCNRQLLASPSTHTLSLYIKRYGYHQHNVILHGHINKSLL